MVLKWEPSSVQDVVAIQWAMGGFLRERGVAWEGNYTNWDFILLLDWQYHKEHSMLTWDFKKFSFNFLAYWNEQTNKMRNVTKRPRIGLFAGDSCSRPKEAISQSLRFLMLLGFMIQLNACLTIRRLWGRGVKFQDLLVNKFSKILAKCVFDILNFWHFENFFQILIFSSCSLTKGFRISQFCCPST